MIGCLRTRVRKQPIIALYFEDTKNNITKQGPNTKLPQKWDQQQTMNQQQQNPALERTAAEVTVDGDGDLNTFKPYEISYLYR